LVLLHRGGDPARLQQMYADFHLLEDPAGGLWRTLETVAGRARFAQYASGATYLIDPLGNIMLFYAAGSDPGDLKTDLKRLLTWSKLDTPS
jgi:cytochrome oxidase Cu insertion factor (SCO1/SenC/PrrC family)